MDKTIPIMSLYAARACARLETALDLLENIDDTAVTANLIEVAAAIYEASLVLRRITCDDSVSVRDDRQNGPR